MSYKINKRPKDDHSDDEEAVDANDLDKKDKNGEAVDKDTLIAKLQEKYNLLKKEKQSIQKNYFELDQKYAQLEEKQRLSNESKTNQTSHSAEFWQDVQEKLKNDTDGIKQLIKENKLKMEDTNEFGYNLLHFAAFYGNLEITKLCINVGYDSTKYDNFDRDAVKHAQLGQSHHAEQFLRLSQIEGNVGDRIREKAKELQREDGMIDNVINELSKIEDKELSFKETLIQVVTNLIKQKLSFPDFLLSLCWKWMERDDEKPDESELFKTIIETSQSVIKDKDKRDWCWMKNILNKSNVWFRKGKNGYLWFDLLDIANKVSEQQVDELAKDIQKDIDEDTGAWHQLAEFEVPKEKLVALTDPSKQVRQDNIPNGIINEFDRNSLIRNATNANFDGAAFYDLHQYLPKLAINAQILDDVFQKSVMSAFNVDKVSSVGTIPVDDEKTDDFKVTYRRGPVKLLERALSKAQNDYYNKEYPTSACVLDFNRCSLIFDDIGSLLAGLKYFMNKIYGYDCGAIIGIVRSKNGFQEYIKKAQYADIKLNVMIRGGSSSKYNLIGEVQFLLRTMTTFKLRAHNLYAIQREKDFMEGSVQKILPSLLDKTKQLNVVAAGGNSKKLSELMIFSNYTVDDILTVDGESIFIPLCKGGAIKAFKFIAPMLSKEQLIAELFKEGKVKDGRAKRNCIEYAVSNGRIDIVDYILRIDVVRERYSADEKFLHRLVVNIFRYCGNVDLINVWIDKFDLTTEKIVKAFQYKYPDSNSHYAKDKILVNMTALNQPKIMEKLRSIIGSALFAEMSFEVEDGVGNALEYAITRNKLEHTKYFLSVPEIKNKFKMTDDEEENKTVLQRVSGIMSGLFYNSKTDHIFEQQWKACDFDIETIKQGLIYDSDIWFYITVKRLQKMIAVIGAKVFVEKVATVSLLEVLNAISNSGNLSWNKIKGAYDYVLSIPGVSEKFGEDIKKFG